MADIQRTQFTHEGTTYDLEVEIMGGTEAGITGAKRAELLRLADQLAAEADELRNARTGDESTNPSNPQP